MIFVPIIAGWALGVTSAKLIDTRQSRARIVPNGTPQHKSSTYRLKEEAAPPAYEQLTSGVRILATDVQSIMTTADDNYQQFIQKYIDPIFGQTRIEQLQYLNAEDEQSYPVAEKAANREMGLGALALGTTTLGHLFFRPLIPLGILIGISSIWRFYFEAYQNLLKERRLGSIHLGGIYVGMMWFGGYATIGAFGSLLLGILLKIKAITERRSRGNLTQLFQRQPRMVWVRINDVEVEIPFAQLEIGNTLVLQAGQVAPIDGVVVAGAAMLDQHMLTGEAQPVEKSVGDSVLAATLVISGKIDVRVEKAGAETIAGQIGQMLNRTAEYNPAIKLNVIQTADRLALPTLALSAISWPILGPASAMALMGANYTMSLIMLGPLTSLNFLNIAAKRSILVKDGKAIEQINQVDTIVFDKTGTLTLDQPHVAQIHLFNGLDEAAVLTLAATAELRQTHPIAHAILNAAAARGLEPFSIEDVHYEIGYGIRVWIEGVAMGAQDVTAHRQLVRVGSGRFMSMEGIDLPDPVVALTAHVQSQGHSLVMVALNDFLVGCIELKPTVRPEAQRIVAGLQARGLALYIISGDQEAPTQQLAQELGMSGYFANTLPDQKADLVKQLQKEGRQVCFIGDGINDAIAMRTADVSISLRGATTAATDTAQIVLMEGNLNQLLMLFELAHKFEANLKTNFRALAGISVFAVGGIFFAHFTFLATEVLFAVSLLTGLGIATKPLLEQNGHGQDLTPEKSI